MERLSTESDSLFKTNIEKVGRLFPNVITEAKDENGKLIKSIDFELLKQELSGQIVSEDCDRYQLTWPG